MHKIFTDVEFQLDMLNCLLSELSDLDYKNKGTHITSIGAHVRHIIEYIQMLIYSDLNVPVNYENRKRDFKIENDREYAKNLLNELKTKLHKTDKPVSVIEDSVVYKSSYLREMLYMHEHIVHHCAILKIEFNSLSYLNVDPCFGFAKSTLKHMNNNVST